MKGHGPKEDTPEKIPSTGETSEAPNVSLRLPNPTTQDKSPRMFGLLRPYTGLYSANSYMANRPSYRLSNSVIKSDIEKSNGANKIGASTTATPTTITTTTMTTPTTAWGEAKEAPRPAPRRLNSHIPDVLEKTDSVQVPPHVFFEFFSNMNELK